MWDLDLNFWFNLTLLSTKTKFKYQLEEKEIDVVEDSGVTLGMGAPLLAPPSPPVTPRGSFIKCFL